MTDTNNVLAVLPLRDVVVYPHMVIPLFVGREKSIRALERAMEDGKQILLVAQKSAGDDNPQPADIHAVGTVSNILQLLKLPDGTIKVLVEGVQRARIIDFVETDDLYAANCEMIEVEQVSGREAEVLSRSLMTQFEQYVKLNKKVPPEIISSLSSIDDPSRLADTIAAHMAIKIQDKQEVLEIIPLRERLEHLIHLMESEIDLLQVEKRLRGASRSRWRKVSASII